MDDEFYITLCMGINKKKLCIPNSTSLEELSVKVEDLFSVDQDNQKLIWKGRVLNNNGLTLKALKVKKGDTIMVLGQSTTKEKEAFMEKLNEFEKKYYCEESSSKKIHESIDELCHLPSSHDDVKSSKKALLYGNENLMKLLEKIDGMEINIKSDEIRSKRKNLVQDIQKLMDSIDKDYAKLNELA